jgi:hypothetical protein
MQKFNKIFLLQSNKITFLLTDADFLFSGNSKRANYFKFNPIIKKQMSYLIVKTW